MSGPIDKIHNINERLIKQLAESNRELRAENNDLRRRMMRCYAEANQERNRRLAEKHELDRMRTALEEIAGCYTDFVARSIAERALNPQPAQTEKP